MKVEPARWYYWADKLGMIVLQDMPLPTAPTLTSAEVRTYQTRLIDAHSGFFFLGAKPQLRASDLGVGDIVDFHMYSPHLNMDLWLTSKYVDLSTLGRRARLDGEWGAFRVPPSAGEYWNNSAAGALPSASLTDRIVNGLNQMDADARRDQSGSILTQLTDVENEDDGLLTYDRSRLKVSPARVAAANRRLIAAGTGR